MSSAPHIQVETKYIPPSDLSLPAISVQVTRLVGSYMLWVGTTDVAAEDVRKAPLQGRLAKDWACAMPTKDPDSGTNSSNKSNSGIPPAATSLFRSSSSDAALPMAQRLARRFGKQIYLSLDLPPAFDSIGQGARLLLAVEKALLETLKEMEQPKPNDRDGGACLSFRR